MPGTVLDSLIPTPDEGIKAEQNAWHPCPEVTVFALVFPSLSSFFISLPATLGP